MTIAIGETLPDATLLLVTPEGPKKVTTQEYFGGRKIVLFGVPGAFTPTCSNNHLPGFLENRDVILERGIDAIAVVSVNDFFVMQAWAKQSGSEGRIDSLADGSAEFVSAMGLSADLSAAGMGIRSLRFSMIADDCVVKSLNIETERGQAVVSGAAHILEQL